MKTEISYGKAGVAVYRTHATPLRGLTPIPESSFVGRDNILMAADIAVEVLGEAFLAAYTEGDNRLVVATDTMKNFIHAQSLVFGGSTLEGWLDFIGRAFLATYPHMEGLRLTGRELTFLPAHVPTAATPAIGGTAGHPVGQRFGESPVLFQRRRDDHATVSLELSRSEAGVRITDLRGGRADLQLMKVSGSSFALFARDQYTTLPERTDRPLYIHLDVTWRYQDPDLAVTDDHAQYVAAEQVGDVVGVVFHEFVSLSIQHLVHEMGGRILERYPQLREVSFEAQNRLWDLSLVSGSDERQKVYCDPRPPYGLITLTLRRD